MTLAHDILRRKVGPTRAGRPPLKDIAYVGALFGRMLEEELKLRLRMHLSVEIRSADVKKFSAAIAAAEPPALFGVAQTLSSDFGALVALGSSAVELLVELATGIKKEDAPTEEGAAEPGQPERPRIPTLIDEALCEGFAASVIERFEAAASGDAAQGGRQALRFSHFENHGPSVLATPDDIDLLCYDFAVMLEDGRSVETSFCISLGALDLYLAAQKAQATRRPDPRAVADTDVVWSEAMLTAVNDAEYPLIGVLQDLTLTLGDILDMQPGDVLPIDVTSDFSVDLRLEKPGPGGDDLTLATGRLGAVEGRRAVRIEVEPDEGFVDYIAPYVIDKPGEAA